MNSKSEIKSKDVKKGQENGKKGIAFAAFESTLRKDASIIPTTKAELNIFCCPIIVSLNREPDRLTSSAPPPPYEL